MNYGFIIDNRKCIGCHACTVACKAEHDVPLGVNRTWVKYVETGTFPETRRLFSVMRCNHCADAPCTTICPVTALYTREDGIVDFDPNRCIGCKACLQACPYDALYIDPTTHTAAKCNFCAHRIEVGLEPPCAVVCPVHAIIAGDMDDPSTEIAQLIKIQPLSVRKPEKGTLPKVFYIEAQAASLVPAMADIPTAYASSEAREPGVEPRRPARELRAARGSWQAVPGGLLADEIWDRVRAVMGPKASDARRVYDTGQTHRDSWGWKVSAYLWTKSISSGCLMLVPFAGAAGSGGDGSDLGYAAVLASLIFLALTGFLLIADLKRPERFAWVITRPQWRSWLTRGSYILLLFGLVAGGLAAARLMRLPLLCRALAWPGAVLGSAAAVYTAFLFRQSKGRDLWQSRLLPLHLFVQAVVAGLALMVLLRAAMPAAASHHGAGFQTWLFGALALNLALVAVEIFATHQTQDANSAARWARTGVRLHILTWGVILIGHAIPLALLAADRAAPGAAPGIVPGAAVAALVGLGLYEHLYVRAGQSVALS